MQGRIKAHLGSRDVASVVYGAIIGLALVVAIEDHPPGPGVVAATLVGTAVAVGLAGLYSEILGTGARLQRGPELNHILDHAAFVAFGIAGPAVFFVLAGVGVIADHAAFTLAKWCGVGLLCVYGFFGARLAGENVPGAALRAVSAGLIGAALIALKALLH